MPPDLFQQLTLAILDNAADEGLRMIKTIRSYLDTREAFLQDRQELVDHLLAAHKLGPSCCVEAEPPSLKPTALASARQRPGELHACRPIAC